MTTNRAPALGIIALLGLIVWASLKYPQIFLPAWGAWSVSGPYPWQLSRMTFGEIVRLARDVPLSTAQLQKAYDWEISQWSDFGKAILGASLAFLSGVALETLKQSPTLSSDQTLLLSSGLAASLFLYAVCYEKTKRLRVEFLQLYRLLLLLKRP